MKCNVINLVVGLLIVALLGLTGCGGGGSAASPASTGTANNLITSVGWLYENAAPDYSNNGQTCLFNVALYYSESIAATDIDSLIVSAPNGWEWTIPSTNSQFGTSSTGKPYISGQFSFGDNPHAFPLAGTWYFMLRLKNGQISTVQRILHEPGSSTSATHQYLYTGEDWAPSTNSSQYVASLDRFPSQGYTLHYAAGDGGTITTTGLSAAMSSYLAAEPRAYNMVCWLYDANKSYLGYSTTEFSPQDHSRTSLITDDGELLIVPTSTLSSTGQIDLSTVKYLRFVFLDGAQYAPASYSNADYRSLSSLVPVNGSSGTTANPVALTNIATIGNLGFATGVALSPDDKTLFVVSGASCNNNCGSVPDDGGLYAFNTAVSSSPSQIGLAQYPTTGYQWTPYTSIATSSDGKTAYVASGEQEFQIFNTSIPSSPTLLSRTTTTCQATSIVPAADGTSVFVGTGCHNIIQFDITNPLAPTVKKTIGTINSPYVLSVSPDGTQLAVVDQGFAQVIDISSGLMGTSTDISKVVSAPIAIVYVGNNKALIVNTTTFTIVDLTTPSSPYVISQIPANSPSSTSQTGVGIKYIPATHMAYVSYLGILDILDLTDLLNPAIRGSITLSGGASGYDSNSSMYDGIAVSSDGHTIFATYKGEISVIHSGS